MSESASGPLEVLIVSKGHDYDHSSFLQMFASMDDVEATLVEHPAAEAVLSGEAALRYDVVFFYDMCGVPGMDLPHDGSQGRGAPQPGYASAVEALLRRGVGLVLVNHATVSWANWPLWREITGSSFMLAQGELRGQTVPGSGYRGGHGPLANATVKLSADGSLESKHPELSGALLQGIEDGFEITDELYLKTDHYGANAVPVLRADYDFTAGNFSPPPLASAEEQASWDHPQGSNMLVWANAAGRSPIVVSDVGDGPLAYDNPAYRQLMANACRWVASSAARQWAAAQTLGI